MASSWEISGGDAVFVKVREPVSLDKQGSFGHSSATIDVVSNNSPVWWRSLLHIELKETDRTLGEVLALVSFTRGCSDLESEWLQFAVSFCFPNVTKRVSSGDNVSWVSAAVLNPSSSSEVDTSREFLPSSTWSRFKLFTSRRPHPITCESLAMKLLLRTSLSREISDWILGLAESSCKRSLSGELALLAVLCKGFVASFGELSEKDSDRFTPWRGLGRLGLSRGDFSVGDTTIFALCLVFKSNKDGSMTVDS